MKKILSGLVMFAIMFALVVAPAAVNAQLGQFPSLGEGAEANLSLGTGNLEDIVVQLINFVLGFLGLVAVVLIIVGGFKYMMAGGEPDKVTKAKQLIIAGVIGLIIIMLAFILANFVVNVITNSTL